MVVDSQGNVLQRNVFHPYGEDYAAVYAQGGNILDGLNIGSNAQPGGEGTPEGEGEPAIDDPEPGTPVGGGGPDKPIEDDEEEATAVEDASTTTPVTLSTYRHLADGTKYMTISAGSNGALLYRGPLTFTVADITGTTPAISFLRAEMSSAGASIIANANGSAEPYYYVMDQLGSVRAVVDSQGSVVERNDYYTYGKRHTTGRTYADLKNSPLLFSGKEDQGQALDIASGATTPSDLRILDFGARHYDPIVPRWTTPDPLAEKYFPINTYAYCAGDPVNLVDPEGRKIVINGSEKSRKNYLKMLYN